MSKLSMWVAIVAVLLAGLATGLLGGIIWSRYDFQNRMEAFRNRPAFKVNQTLMQRLDEELELTPEQKGKIKPILEAGFAKAKPLFEATRKKLDQHLQETLEQVRQHLSQEQKTKFDQAVAQRLFFPPIPPPPPGSMGMRPPPPGGGCPPQPGERPPGRDEGRPMRPPARP